jgi:ADP-heptose:LPS heptosyltransferase
MFRSIQWLRAQHFDLVIDLQCLARSAIFAWLSRGQFLVGLDEVREGARGFYDVAVRRTSFHTHAVDWYLSVLPVLDVPVHRRFTWLPERPEIAAAVNRKWPNGTPHPAPDRSAGAGVPHWIALLPGARWQNKRWPVEHFAELARVIARQFPETRLAVLGGKDDHLLGEIISESIPERCLNLCGQTSLPEMVEWIRRCDLLVTNDTGPMHAAAALHKPMVALFGPTEPRRTGPYGHLDRVLRHDLPCSPCLKPTCHFEHREECLVKLSPAQVLAQIHQQLA